MESLTSREYDVLLKEYELLHARVNDYDSRLFQIKGWSITIFSAMLGFAILKDKPLLLIVPFFTCFIFWGLDALYKSFQRITIERTVEVESFFNGTIDNIKPARVSLSFEDRDTTLLGRIKRVGGALFVFNVMALYIGKLIILAIVGLALINANL